MKRLLPLAIGLAVAVVAAPGLTWAAGLTLTAQQLAAAAPAAPVMFPVSVVLADKAGQPVGKVNNGDTITVVWSQLVQAPTVCSTATNTTGLSNATFKWSISAGGGVGGDDVLAPSTTGSAVCASGLHVGSIDLGAAGYNTNATTPIDFPNAANTLTFGATTTTLTVTLNGQKNGTAGTVAAGTAATWTPDAAVTDRSGRTCGSNLAQTSATVQF